MATIPLPALHTAPIQQPQSPLEAYAQVLGIQKQQQATQMAQQEAPVRQQILGQQAQAGQLELQQAQQQQQDQQTFRAAMADPSNKGKTIGAVADTLADSGHISPQSWQAMKKADIEQRTALATLDEKGLANAKAAHSATQELYNSAMDMPDDQLAQNWPQIAQQYDAIPGNQKMPLDPSKPLTKQQLQQFGPMLSMQGAYVDEATQRQEKQATLRKTTADAALAETNAQRGGTTDLDKFQGDYMQSHGLPNTPENRQKAFQEYTKQTKIAPAEVRAQVLLQTPTQVYDPTTGKTTYQTRQNAIGQETPQSVEALAGKAGVQADAASLKKLQTNFDQVSAFEGTAGKNLDLFINKLSAIPDLKSKFMNVPMRMIDAKMIGSDNYQAMKAAQQTAAAEAAKVLSSANASGVLSDSQKKEAEDMLSGNLTLSAAKQVVETLKQDFSNRHQSYQQQIQDIQTRLKGSGGMQPAGGNQPSGNGNSPMTITLPSGKKISIE